MRAWRSKIAKANSVPDYVILHHSMLAELARSRPVFHEALRNIVGLGASKFKCVTDALLKIISTA
ncbi:HRDC domain-containing protein [Candidatus Vallotia cooleyia]|uniref:HRDC domain-containing protein n=1 Tax=Candidatus Vallotiella adelgis TaxID=1177211 RepID=UPI001D002B3C